MVKEQLHCQNKVCSEQMYNPLVQMLRPCSSITSFVIIFSESYHQIYYLRPDIIKLNKISVHFSNATTKNKNFES